MNVQSHFNPKEDLWPELVRRPLSDSQEISAIVADIMDEVRRDGDKALIRLTAKFDQYDLKVIEVPIEEVRSSGESLDIELKQAIQQAHKNIGAFHSGQLSKEPKIETMEGVHCWRESRPIDAIGLYIPGGSAPLFSTVLMLAVPAKIAGCKNMVLCTPPGPDGKINPAILYAANLCGITNVCKVGGAQAIAAMTFGTATVSKVDKIFGPGNRFVTEAKMQALQHGSAIDMPAGPSEVLVIADHTADPAYVASDMISQAEHGADSQAVLVTTEEKLIDLVTAELAKQLLVLPRKSIAKKSLARSKLIFLPMLKDALAFSNLYAPEHLILSVNDPSDLIAEITNAGSVFLGHYSPEAVGDYASGTNHTLPTNGWARSYSGVSVDAYIKKITFQQLSKQGLEHIAHTVITMAEAESLRGHAQAVKIRLDMD